jgi:hypothetical protein
MTDFYRGPCARITHKVFEPLTPVHRWFAISDLRGVHIVHVGPEGRSADAIPVRLYTTGVAGAAMITGWPVFGSVPMSVVAMIALAAASVWGGGCWRSRPHSYELHGLYRGSLQLLFSTPDARVFGQVSRALARALAYRADTN